MIHSPQTGILAALFALATGTAAQAALIDFTDLATFTTATAASASGTAAGVGFTITGSRPALTYNVASGPGPTGVLAGLTDGIGIGDDEIGGNEWVSITFDRDVRLIGAAFLDFFRSPNEAEHVTVYSGAPPLGAGLASLSATERGGDGYAFVGLSAVGRTFSFASGLGNDGRGIGDFAFAGVEFEELGRIAPVPLPVSGSLLASGLGALFLTRRRKA